jgi:hypothetical protein
MSTFVLINQFPDLMQAPASRHGGVGKILILGRHQGGTLGRMIWRPFFNGQKQRRNCRTFQKGVELVVPPIR